MNREELPKTGEIFAGLAYAGVWQDKEPQERFVGASRQPGTAKRVDDTAGQGSETAAAPADNRQTRHGSENRQTEHIAGRVLPHIKSEVLRLAKLNGWTESKTVATLVEQALARNLAEQFGVKLAAVVTDALNKGMQKQGNRQAYLSVQGYYAAEEARIINTRVLRYLFGDDTEIYKQIVEDARKEARANIRRNIEEK